MKTTYRILFLIALCVAGLKPMKAQNALWITGSAVPGGTQQLEKFPIANSSAYCFKFHGKLLPGDLYIVTTEEPKSSRYYYAPKLVDSNIVNNGIAWNKIRKEEGSAWAVLFEADNYRFTITTSEGGTVKGELFTWWYEAWIVGGCTEDNQGVKENDMDNGKGKWQLHAGKLMEQNPNNPYEWTWTGELKNYTNNVEPKRFKINGQYGWSPKSLHPHKQDSPILTASQVIYSETDNKWVIGDDGFYRITTNVFTETIKGEYLGTDLSGFEPVTASGLSLAGINISGRQVQLSSDVMVTASLFAPNGTRVDMQTGTQPSLAAPAAGVYILFAETADGTTLTKKIRIE